MHPVRWPVAADHTTDRNSNPEPRSYWQRVAIEHSKAMGSAIEHSKAMSSAIEHCVSISSVIEHSKAMTGAIQHCNTIRSAVRSSTAYLFAVQHDKAQESNSRLFKCGCHRALCWQHARYHTDTKTQSVTQRFAGLQAVNLRRVTAANPLHLQ